MPQAICKPCGAHGCPELVRGQRFCPAHRKTADTADRARRGSSSERGYGARWQHYRAPFLGEFPLCGMGPPGMYSAARNASQCAATGRTTLAVAIHHVKGHHGPNSELFWDPLNHQAICASCHNAESARQPTA